MTNLTRLRSIGLDLSLDNKVNLSPPHLNIKPFFTSRFHHRSYSSGSFSKVDQQVYQWSLQQGGLVGLSMVPLVGRTSRCINGSTIVPLVGWTSRFINCPFRRVDKQVYQWFTMVPLVERTSRFINGSFSIEDQQVCHWYLKQGELQVYQWFLQQGGLVGVSMIPLEEWSSRCINGSPWALQQGGLVGVSMVPLVG